MKPEDSPLKFEVVDGQAVIRIGIHTLAYCFETGNDNHSWDQEKHEYRRNWKILDPEKFARGVLCGLQDEEEDGSTPVTRILDAAFIRAVEDDMGVDEDGRYGIDPSSSPWIGESEELSQGCIDGYKDSPCRECGQVGFHKMSCDTQDARTNFVRKTDTE
jgi:hypothetical protein